ncbi:MAG: AHH domain-containing protein [Fibrobacter sp.]|nr:AHH domain-containing protein [Fibrobacter sp.]
MKTSITRFPLQTILFALLCFAGTSEAAYTWKKTSENIYVWVNQDSLDYDYSWKGKAIEKVAHGPGTMTISKNGKTLAKREANAFYGSFSPKSYGVTSKNDTIIGNLDSYRKVNGFAVVVKDSGKVYIGSYSDGLANGAVSIVENGTVVYRGNVVNNLRDGWGDECDAKGVCKNTLWKNNQRVSRKDSLETVNGKYVGEVTFKGNRPIANGKGRLITDRYSLEGNWTNDTITGYAEYISDSSQYSGDFKAGRFYGYGELTTDTLMYHGMFVDGKPSGYGELYTNTDYYAGEWKNGTQNGHGRVKTDRYVYEGSWEEGLIHGNGTIRYSNGDLYTGTFLAGQRYGLGHYEFENGNVYEGEFVENLPNGLGHYSYKDGSYYDGEFTNGKFDGDGTLVLVLDNDTVSITANWSSNENKLPSYASILFSNGDVYDGPLVNGAPTDEGVWSTQKQRETKDFAHTVNDFYKAHKAQWEKFVDYSSIVLGVASVFVPEVAPLYFAVNGINLAVVAFSGSVDLYDSVQAGGSVGSAVGDLALNIGANSISIVAPKLLSSSFAKGIVSSLSKTAVKKAPALVNIAKNGKKVFAKTIQVVKDEAGNLAKKLVPAKARQFAYKLVSKASDQYLKKKEYKVCRNKDKLSLGLAGDGGILRKNMCQCMDCRLDEAEGDFLGKRRAQAHHVVPKGGKNSARFNEILGNCGIDINDPRNGILLPIDPSSIFKGSIHSNHKANYETYVLERLETVYRKKKGGKCPVDAIEKVLDDIKDELYAGTLSLNSKKPFSIFSPLIGK